MSYVDGQKESQRLKLQGCCDVNVVRGEVDDHVVKGCVPWQAEGAFAAEECLVRTLNRTQDPVEGLLQGSDGRVKVPEISGLL